MNAIEILFEEHDVILEFLKHLDVAAKRIADNRGPSKEFFEKSLGFCRTFADRYHHYKEEYVLFGLLAEKNNGALDGEIGRHRAQHEHCRNLVQAVSDGLPGYSREMDSSSRLVHRNLAEYIKVLRSHIRSENEILFPMAVKALTEPELEQLLEEFKKYEAKTGPNVIESHKDRIVQIAGML